MSTADGQRAREQRRTLAVLRPLRRLYSIGAALSGLCLVSAGILVVLQIVGRMAGVLVPSVPELAGFLLGATIFLALADTQRLGEHIRVTVLFERAGRRVTYALEVLYRIVGLLILSGLAWFMLRLAYESWEYNDRSAGMIGIPYWIPQSAMTLGVILLCIRFADELVHLLVLGHAGEDRTGAGDLGAS